MTDSLRNASVGSFNRPRFKFSWELESAQISKSGDIGYLLKTTRMNMTDSLGKPATQAFKAVTIWKKVAEGSWECAVDVLSHLPAEKQ